MRPAANGPGHFCALIGHSNTFEVPMRNRFRRRAVYPRFTLIVIRLNIGLCLFGVAAIITAVLT